MRYQKILLIAKPWRGGLANYVFTALNKLFQDQVEWIPTRPVSVAEKIRYRMNRKEWVARLVDTVTSKERDLAIFINHLDEFNGIDFHAGNLLWVTDGPNPQPGDYAPYAKVFLSDTGYLENVARVIPEERLGGELGFACCPDAHNWQNYRSEQKQLCFIGNKDPKRDSYVEALLASGVDFTVVGNYFLRHPLFWKYPKQCRPSVRNAKMGQIYSDHQLSLNLHARVVRRGTNMRTFECAAYGIPQLVEYRPGLETFFEPGKEIITFESIDEMLEKVNVLLADVGKRKQLATNAMARVNAEHTYLHRIQTMLGKV